MTKIDELTRYEIDSLYVLEKVVEVEHNEALFEIAHRYYNGYGGAIKNIPKALEWCNKSAKHGNLSALINLACMYLKGINGIPKQGNLKVTIKDYKLLLNRNL
ncbi:MAG: sel1 repeat family protein [Rickettsiaceae bacterium]|nr:sel1 repeat family protein [Rickettsiaceae bacterium]